MQQDHRQHTPLTRRKAVDRLIQLRAASTGRKLKKVNQWIRKLVVDQVKAKQ